MSWSCPGWAMRRAVGEVGGVVAGEESGVVLGVAGPGPSVSSSEGGQATMLAGLGGLSMGEVEREEGCLRGASTGSFSPPPPRRRRRMSTESPSVSRGTASPRHSLPLQQKRRDSTGIPVTRETSRMSTEAEAPWGQEIFRPSPEQLGVLAKKLTTVVGGVVAPAGCVLSRMRGGPGQQARDWLRVTAPVVARGARGLRAPLSTPQLHRRQLLLQEQQLGLELELPPQHGCGVGRVVGRGGGGAGHRRWGKKWSV